MRAGVRVPLCASQLPQTVNIIPIKPGQADRSEGILPIFLICHRIYRFWPQNVINFGPRRILRYSLDETDRMARSGARNFRAEFKIDILDLNFQLTPTTVCRQLSHLARPLAHSAQG